MEVCIRHRCFECCRNTKMLLSNEDIRRIRRLGFQKDYFVLEKEGWFQLRNRKGVCVFIDGGKCSIYEYRPDGCKIYPLIFDEEIKLTLLDPECPYKNEFKIIEQDSRSLFNLLEKLIAERKNRLR